MKKDARFKIQNKFNYCSVENPHFAVCLKNKYNYVKMLHLK